MKGAMTILFFSLILICCSPQKEIQVEMVTWTLIEKKPSVRWIRGKEISCVWMVWQNEEGTKYNEFVSEWQAAQIKIGATIKNKEAR